MGLGQAMTARTRKALGAGAGLALVVVGALLGGPWLIVSVVGAARFAAATVGEVRSCRCRG